jgi:membrane-associated phospholipid phosphatase
LEVSAQHVLSRIDRGARELLLRPSWVRGADRASNLLAYLGAPAATGWVLSRTDSFGPRLIRDLIRVARAATVTGAVNQVIKHFAARRRPFAAADPEADGKDRLGSFFSNHTSSATAMASAAGRIVRSRGARRWTALPLTGIAFLIGYLRIAADRHYLTDVLAGAAFGATSGLLLTL